MLKWFALCLCLTAPLAAQPKASVLSLLQSYAKQKKGLILNEDIKAYQREGVNAILRDGEDSLLGISAFQGWDDLVEALLDDGAKIAIGFVGDTPLHTAIYGTGGHPKTAALLIGRGADVNAKASDGMTPLHWAAVMGDRVTAEFLIQRGAAVNALDRQGKTPLAKAQTEAMKALLKKHGAK